MTAFTAAPAPAQDDFELPSGLRVTLQELLADDSMGGALYRARFVAPGLAGESRSGETLVADMTYLCEAVALKKLADIRAEPTRIVISLGSEATEFGVARPDVKQVFEAFTVEQDTCIWEAF